MPQFLDTTEPDFEARFAALLSAKREDSPDVDHVVAGIIADVRARGDAAVLELTAKFDRLELTPETMAFSAEEIDAEIAKVPAGEREALERAAQRIRAYHVRQMPEDALWTDPDGATLGWRWTPVSAAGIYVPGGLASYPSSVLMNAIPAKVAGVERLAMCVPTPGGVVNPLVLLAARIAGADEVYRVGGAQAVAALAYGTDTIAPVDKITGPGNAFVAAAKRRVFGKVGIDMIAGPSEILVIADADNTPDWLALDLLSQAEHDPVAQSILITDDAAFGRKVAEAVDNRLKTLIDGLTRPANKEQMQNHVAPLDGGPTYCLLQDDRLVQRIGLDTRRWYGAPSDPSESLVVVTAKVVLSADVTVNGPTSATFLVL